MTSIDNIATVKAFMETLTFYRNDTFGYTLRVAVSDDKVFHCLDENDDNETYSFEYEKVDLENDHFYKLEEVKDLNDHGVDPNNIASIKAFMEKVTFYCSDVIGYTLRVNYCDTTEFNCHDEETLTDYQIDYDGLDFKNDKFYIIVKTSYSDFENSQKSA